MTNHVSTFLKKERGLYVGPLTAERIKTQHAATLGTEFEDLEFPVAGRDALSGAPKEICVSRKEVSEAIDPCIRDIVDHIRQLLIDVPPELAADVVECGVFLTGGGALMPGLCERIRNDLGLPAFMVEDPLFAVVKGAARILSDRAFLRVLQRNSMFST
jgi:rod shape-determining protein MreB